jgi:hypothetical protein
VSFVTTAFVAEADEAEHMDCVESVNAVVEQPQKLPGGKGPHYDLQGEGDARRLVLMQGAQASARQLHMWQAAEMKRRLLGTRLVVADFELVTQSREQRHPHRSWQVLLVSLNNDYAVTGFFLEPPSVSTPLSRIMANSAVL